MRKIIIAILVSGLCLSACSAEQRADMEKDRLESFDLTPKQYEIAQALVEGYKTDTGMPLLRTQDYARAGCYAKAVKMPPMYERAHLLYLKNYPEADRDFYGFFKRHGIGDNMAWEMSQKFQSAYDSCSTRNMIKKRLGK